MKKTFDASSLKPWQKKFIEFARHKKFFFLNGPPGIGKTLATAFVAARHVRQGGKVLIVAPQLDILTNYLFPQGGIAWSTTDVQQWTPVEPGDARFHGDGEESEEVENSKSKKLMTFFEKGHGMVMLASHYLLGRVSDLIEPRHLDGLLLVVDEAHHCKEDASATGYSKLGRVVQMAVDLALQGSDTRVAMVTASPFRSDRYPLLNDKTMETCFSRSSGNMFELPMAECLKDNKIQSVNFHLVTFPAGKLDSKLLPTNYPDAVEHVYRDLIPRLKRENKLQVDVGIVNMPHTNSGYNRVAGNRRAVQHERLYNALAKYRRKIWDFADVESQQESMAEFKRSVAAKKPVDADLILTMNMFQEGSDHPPADHTVLIGYTTAFTRTYQRIGRITRMYPNKKDVHVIILMPVGVSEKDDREAFNRFLKSVCMAYVCQAIFNTATRESGHKDSEEEAASDEDSPEIVLVDPATATDCTIEALHEVASKRDSYDRNKSGELTTLGFKQAVEAGASAIRKAAEKAGASKPEQEAMVRMMRLRLPQLLDTERAWAADKIDVQLVADSSPTYHVSRPITYELLRKFEQHVASAPPGRRSTYLKLIGWIEAHRRKPIKSGSAEEKDMYRYYRSFSDPMHPWGDDSIGFKRIVESKIRPKAKQADDEVREAP